MSGRAGGAEELFSEAVDRLRALVLRGARIDRRLLVHLVFTPATTGMLHVGGGGRGEVQLQLLRVGGQPYVPPTSVKGVFRRVLEHLVKGSLGSLRGVDRLLAGSHSEGAKGVSHATGDAQRLGRRLILDTDDRFAEEVLPVFVPWEDIVRLREEGAEPEHHVVEPLLSALCPICRLLGSQGVAGMLKVMGVRLGTIGVAHRPHVGIDRGSRTRSERVFYVEEAIQLDRLEVFLVVDNPEPGSPESLALAGLLEYLGKAGVLLGGGRSRGLGGFLLDRGSRGFLIDYSKAGSGEELAEMLATRLEDVASRGVGLDQVIGFLRGGSDG